MEDSVKNTVWEGSWQMSSKYWEGLWQIASKIQFGEGSWQTASKIQFGEIVADGVKNTI